MSASSRSILVCVAFAIGTVAIIDAALQRIVPLVHKREVADGIDQLKASDPEILVVGSSHARTFHVLGEQLARATDRTTPLVAVPLENGKLIPYDWLVQNRIAPIVDEVGAGGKARMANLRRFILLTEWWDSCVQYPDGVHWNLPSRAWAVDHYLTDVFTHGMNTYNRNFAQYKYRQLFRHSVLVHDRTDPMIRDALIKIAQGRPLGLSPSEYAEKLERWQFSLVRGNECIGNAQHIAALDSILDFAVSRGLETTVVLFPRMPGTLTDRAKATTLARFAELVEQHARPRGVRVVDLTWKTPLRDEDFMADFDHVSAAGNLKFARWALQNDLSFLLAPPTNERTRTGQFTVPAQ